jgi:hypothetical protein
MTRRTKIQRATSIESKPPEIRAAIALEQIADHLSVIRVYLGEIDSRLGAATSVLREPPRAFASMPMRRGTVESDPPDDEKGV